MAGTDNSALHLEWNQLQRQFDEYEKYSLILKLASILVVSLLLFHSQFDAIAPALVLALWFQDGIWKTFQSRIGQRLIVVEKAILEQQSHKAMQFNTAWLENRPSLFGLIGEYISNSIRPTVAFPHLFLFVAAAYITIIH